MIEFHVEALRIADEDVGIAVEALEEGIVLTRVIYQAMVAFHKVMLEKQIGAMGTRMATVGRLIQCPITLRSSLPSIR